MTLEKRSSKNTTKTTLEQVGDGAVWKKNRKGIVMRKLLLQMQMSIEDTCRRDGGMDWMVWSYGSDWTWDSKIENITPKSLASVDCILLSRKMLFKIYRSWAAMAQRTDNPNLPLQSVLQRR